jgi:hypothetical protein
VKNSTDKFVLGDVFPLFPLIVEGDIMGVQSIKDSFNVGLGASSDAYA